MKTHKVAMAMAFGVLSGAFLCMPMLLDAKCWPGLVEVRGTVECVLQHDWKVLVSLTYSGRQSAEAGEEIALNLHDGSFSRKVAFDRFKSFNRITGNHNCSRVPKSVIVRLVGADGREWDRKELRFVDAFRYDEENGKYEPQSDVVLRGPCGSDLR